VQIPTLDSSLGRTSLVRGLSLACAFFATVLTSPTALAQLRAVVELRNGLLLGPGLVSETDSISSKSSERANPGNVNSKSIGILDDGLRNTYFNNSPRNMIAVRESTAAPFEEIRLASDGEAAKSGSGPKILGLINISAFNKYGRRTYSIMTPRGRVDVLQGITVLTPLFAKVDVLRTGTEDFVWDQRIATTSIPAAELRAILYQAVDLSKSGEWLRLVTFYSQAKRFDEAHEIMSEALHRFPTELADRAPVLTQLNQLSANQKFEEIRLRKNSGQHQLATSLMGQFPLATLSGENQLKLDVEIKGVQQQVVLVSELVHSLKAQVAKLPEPDQQFIAPVVQELEDQVNLDSVLRLDDFNRLRNDSAIPAENLVAYAVGGWLLGSGAGLDNFAVAKSLVRVRELVRQYLNVPTAAERQQLLQQLQGEEGAQPALLARLIQTMAPPLAAPAPRGEDPEGFIRLQTQPAGQPPLNYVVQLPPEYDPNRKYPCVLALPGRSDSPDLEIDWWCGMNMELDSGKFRFGQATRYGYIVISPAWMDDKQREYQYTEGEKSRILSAFRDGLRRFSVDTDRVFVAGHLEGGTAAWDLALSHPDIWAGAILISPGADKYIMHYTENIRISARALDQVPLGFYLVYGELDGTRAVSMMGAAATKCLSSPNYDAVAVEYHGEGRVRFASELPRIMEWMELSSHRRIRNLQNIETRTMRPGDRMFYWLEAPAILPELAGNPFQFQPKNFGVFDGRILDSTANGVAVNKIPSPNQSAVVWLTPDMVDFNRPVKILGGGRTRLETLSPSIEVMLEDVRQRADRLHFAWQKVTL